MVRRSSSSRSSNRSFMNNLNQLLIFELHQLLDAELQLVEVLPALAKMASNTQLKHALRDHLSETKNQVNRLKQIFNLLEISPNGNVRCIGMEGLIAECQQLLSNKLDNTVKDAFIILSAQRVEHYEIACYGTVKAFANQLDLDEIANLLGETLDEESNLDKLLTRIAEGTFFTAGINKQAADAEMVYSGIKETSRNW